MKKILIVVGGFLLFNCVLFLGAIETKEDIVDYGDKFGDVRVNKGISLYEGSKRLVQILIGIMIS